jgi:hypothetical protein
MKSMAVIMLVAATAYPMPKQGQCPSGYHQSGAYCAPMNENSKPAIPKTRQCPSGWFKSGNYCEKMKK